MLDFMKNVLIDLWKILKIMKRQATDWDKVFLNHISDKGLISEYIKKCHNSTAK